MSHPAATGAVAPALHWPNLAAGLCIMFAGTLYPGLMMNAAGRADYALALLLLLAMSAGLVRGVGFVPRARAWAALFSGWTCAGALGAAALLKLVQ